MHTPSLSAMIESLSLSDRATMATTHLLGEHEIDALLHDATRWQQCLDRLPRPAQSIIARIRRAGGWLPVSILEAIAGPFRTNLDTISPRTLLTIYQPLTPLEQLFVCGVVWPHQTSTNGRVWFVPREVEQLLAPIPPLFKPDTLLADVVEHTTINLDELLVTVACLAVDGRVVLQQQGRVSQVMLNRIGRDDISLLMMQWLMSCWLAAGVFRVDATGIVPTQRLLDWLVLQPHERAQELVRGWLHASWNEWDMAHTKKRPPAMDIRYARRTVVHAFLSHLPEEWCAWQHVIDNIQMAWPDMVRPANQQGKWQAPPGWPTNWHQEDGLLIEFMLRGPAQWLGLVEWDEDAVYVRRTAFGGWIAGVNPTPADILSKPAQLESDGTVIITDTTNYFARFQLHRIADWRDQMTAVITPARVRKAISTGMSSNTYLEILQSVLDAPISSTQETLIRAWANDVAQVVAHAAVIIKAPSADVLVDILHDRQVLLSEYQVLNETTIALAPQRAAQSIRRLRQAGYIVDVQHMKSPQFDDAELEVLDSVLHQIVHKDEKTRQVHSKIMQLRRKGNTHG